MASILLTSNFVQYRRTSSDAATRLACYEGLVSIGPCVVDEFVEIVKLRNVYGRAMGYVDYYDMKCQQAEGFSKDTLFGILDDLERKTAPLLVAARAQLAAEKGPEALLPQSTAYYMSGDTAVKKGT